MGCKPADAAGSHNPHSCMHDLSEISALCCSANSSYVGKQGCRGGHVRQAADPQPTSVRRYASAASTDTDCCRRLKRTARHSCSHHAICMMHEHSCQQSRLQ